MNMAFLAQTSASREVMAREKRPLVRDATRVDGMPEEKRQRPALARSELCTPIFSRFTSPSLQLLYFMLEDFHALYIDVCWFSLSFIG